MAHEAETASMTDTATDDPAREPAERSLGAQVGRGAAWATASNLIMRFASIAVTALLARLLSKEDFGVFAIALGVYLIVGALAELGMGSAVARSAREPEDIAPTVATISIGISLLLGLGMAVGADVLAAFLGEPEAASPLRVLSLSLVLTGIFAVPGAQLVREFRQDRIFLGTVVGFLVANPVLILLAVNGGGATAFAWSRVIGQLAGGLVFVLSTSRVYRPGWARAEVGALLRFGLPLSLANLVNWSLLNADYLILGRMLTAAEVGVYLIAFNVASWSTSILGSVLNNVLVPAFGRVQDSQERMRDALLHAARVVALVAFPVAALTVALSDSLIVTVFGAKWSDASPVLGVLAVYGVLYAFSLLLVNVLVAVGATARLLAIQVAWIIGLVPAIVLLLPVHGLVGVAWAHVLAIVALAIPCYAAAVRHATHQPMAPMLRVTGHPAAAAAAAGFAAWLVSLTVQLPWAQFVLGGLAGGIVYVVLVAPMVFGLLPEERRSALRLRAARLLAR